VTGPGREITAVLDYVETMLSNVCRRPHMYMPSLEAAELLVVQLLDIRARALGRPIPSYHAWLAERFGHQVRNIMDGIAPSDSLTKSAKTEEFCEHLRAMVDDLRQQKAPAYPPQPRAQP
jgi:hypothetical protein